MIEDGPHQEALINNKKSAYILHAPAPDENGWKQDDNIWKPAAACFQTFRSVFRGLGPDDTEQQRTMKTGSDRQWGWALTAVETNQTAEVGVGCFLLHTYRVCIAQSCQVVIHHLEWTLRGFQPPAGHEKRRQTANRFVTSKGLRTSFYMAERLAQTTN